MREESQVCTNFNRKLNPFASLKTPKVDTTYSDNFAIFIPIVEVAFGANKVVAGVKCKNTL